MTLSETAPSAPLRPRLPASRAWFDWILAAAAAVALFAAVHAWFDWRSGIQHLVQGARVQAGGARGSATDDGRVS